MMHCIGLDIIEIERIQNALDHWGARFLNRIYTAAELKLCQQRPAALAGRFAGKEAVMKALGTGAKGVGWKEIEILSDPLGKPLVHLYDKAQKRAATLGLDEMAISLSHSREYAVAFVVADAR